MSIPLALFEALGVKGNSLARLIKCHPATVMRWKRTHRRIGPKFEGTALMELDKLIGNTRTLPLFEGRPSVIERSRPSVVLMIPPADGRVHHHYVR